MADSEPPDVQQPRSLRDRFAGIFRPGLPYSRSASPSILGEGHQAEVNARTQLLDSYSGSEPVCGGRPCSHGTFSPRPVSEQDPNSSKSSIRGLDASHHSEQFNEGSSNLHLVEGDGISSAPLGSTHSLSATKQLAKKHGVKNHRSMYIAYYVPFFNWVGQYRWSFFQGDLVSAITIASIYIPMALSLASNVAHAPAINGLYSFVLHPLIYAILGSNPLLIVGPEAAGSLLVGTVIRNSAGQGEESPALNAQVVGVVSGLTGAIVLIGGITRLGFLDNILSRPFLRGFISAIGFMILVDQLIPEMGLTARAKEVGGVTHGSSVDKLIFLFNNANYSHTLTWAVAFGSFAIIMVFRTLKRRLEPRFPNVVFIPDRFLVVFLSAVLTWNLRWDQKGLAILGSVKDTGNGTFAFRWPFRWSELKHTPTAMSTSFIIALLGFFESSIAAKGLGDGTRNGIQGMTFSANRELVALGVANVVGGCFMALPSFGGYGRSKLNVATGGQSPMSSVFLSLITLACILFFLPYFYYLPMAVLSSMISVVAYTLVEECPHDIRFFFRLRSWSDLSLMFIIFFSTIFYSIYLGIALGIGLSVLSIIRHSTKPRIQILGKVNGTRDRFENAETNPGNVEFIEGCLIVKIPEPLTFANTGDLKNRLRRLEFYGTNAVHPALPRVRSPEHNKNIIFDIHGVTSIDGSGIQVLCEIIQAYIDNGVSVFFCRLPRQNSDVWRMIEKSSIVEICGGRAHFVRSVDEALRLTEMADMADMDP
ncbi:hypothetical protein AJ80_02869 [Polytolypa hystricis UAMH7299]|uniref:STAS domain-containing protein n=1 Tax=Polytolypa hystricis (strain UAMH7299) TaxID=1447883 RepID=A0A2B7YP61_POLH7|nr:hypothetical protein AJ80_02869 [Polytolypa hystricis UAMH7299]